MTAGADGGIRARGLTRRFGERVALHPIDFTVGPGQITGLLGPNGSGKSTLLRLLIGLVPADAGEVQVDGVPLRGDGTAIRRRCTYSPGEISLYGEMRAREHLLWFLRGRESASRARALELAERLELPLGARVHTYSHGMKRQLLFIAALAPRVRVRILDEPTEGLDPSLRAVMLRLLREEVESGVTVLLSSHHLAEVDRACDHLLFLHQGRLLSSEMASSVRERAERTLRVEWPAGADMAMVQRETERLGHEVVHRGRTSAFLLPEPDPLSFLARLAALPGLPSPRSIEYGKTSLNELYRDRYGVEGC
jgi:ABC-2 type transport system ATP-binding protein